MPPASRRVNRYELVRLIGRGGMATVHLARDPGLDREVAVKELAAVHVDNPELLHRFMRESRLAGSLNHPNLVTVYEFFEHEGVPYLAMEYLERGSLRSQIGTLTMAQIAGVLEGILAGVGEAGRSGIVHRDLKPENVLVTGDGRVKVADFGIAKAVDQMTQVDSFRTATGQTIGTPTYMAPEQAMAQELGPWTDLYSIGVMAYELFSGAPPFSSPGAPMALLMKHVTEPPPPLAAARPDLDPRIVAWVERLLAKEPTARPPTADAAWETFEEIVLDTVGPRWRRSARLLDPARAATRPPLTPAPGHAEAEPATPSEPSEPSEPIAIPATSELLVESPTQRLEPATGGRTRPHTTAQEAAAAPPPRRPPAPPTRPTRPLPPSPPPAPRPRPRRGRAGPLLLIAAALAAVLVVAVLLLGGGDDGGGSDDGGRPRTLRQQVTAAFRPLLTANDELKDRLRALRPGDAAGDALRSAEGAQDAAADTEGKLRDLSPANASERTIRADARAAVDEEQRYLTLVVRMLRRQASAAQIEDIGPRSDAVHNALEPLERVLPKAEATIRGAKQLKAWAKDDATPSPTPTREGRYGPVVIVIAPPHPTGHQPPGGGEGVVTWHASATQDGRSVDVNCNPPSGSSFGPTGTVTCTARGRGGKTATKSFTVTVTGTTETVTPEPETPTPTATATP